MTRTRGRAAVAIAALVLAAIGARIARAEPMHDSGTFYRFEHGRRVGYAQFLWPAAGDFTSTYVEEHDGRSESRTTRVRWDAAGVWRDVAIVGGGDSIWVARNGQVLQVARAGAAPRFVSAADGALLVGPPALFTLLLEAWDRGAGAAVSGAAVGGAAPASAAVALDSLPIVGLPDAAGVARVRRTSAAAADSASDPRGLERFSVELPNARLVVIADRRRAVSVVYNAAERSGYVRGGDEAVVVVAADSTQALPAPRRRPQDPAPPFPYVTRDVGFDVDRAPGVRLAGTLTVPEGPGPFPAALLLTGSGAQTRDEELLGHRPFRVIADALARRGVATLRVDDRGVGRSTGSFAGATSDDFANDALAGFRFLASQPEVDPRRVGLIGHSEGALIAAMLASRERDVAFAVLLAGPGVPGEQLMLDQNAALMRASGASDSAIAGARAINRLLFDAVLRAHSTAEARAALDSTLKASYARLDPVTRRQLEAKGGGLAAEFDVISTPWFRHFLAADPSGFLKDVRCPVLALGGSKDLQVPARENLAAIRSALARGGNARAKTVELPGLNHLFQNCRSGLPMEYGQIDETFAPAALDTLETWLAAHTRR
ncbi:MAG TPA: alpha/beta fold hydrolase [Candidatus Saccharimonadaceae bacterium]|nr:alpha/beta fold hydrolase [Candidatus Saccharimonadaceae bacterium]